MSNLFTSFEELVQKHSVLLTFKMIWSYICLRKGLIYLFFMIFIISYFFPFLFLLSIPLLIFTLLELLTIGKELLYIKNFYNFLRTIKKNNLYDKALEENFLISSVGLLFGWGTLFITGTILFIIFFMTLEGLHDVFLIENFFSLVNYKYSLYLIPLALLIFIYLQPLVLFKFLKSTSFWDGYLSAFYIFSIFVWQEALTVRYIKYLFSLFIITLTLVFMFIMMMILMIKIVNSFATYFIVMALISSVVMILYFVLVFILMTTLVANRLIVD